MIQRYSKGKVLAGVCSGLHKYNGVNVTLARVVFGVGSFFFWFPAIVYGVLWAISPDENGNKLFNGSAPSGGGIGSSSEMSSTTLEGELKRIQGLKESGLVSEEDFNSLRSKTMAAHSGDEQVSGNDAVRTELERLQKMHDDGMINADELANLRKKALGI